MKIVLDLQGAQSESRFRGIGRYTLSLAEAITREAVDHEIIIALNSSFKDSIERLKSFFSPLVSPKNIVIWKHPFPTSEGFPQTVWRREVAERVREDFIARLNPDIVHISTLFEGFYNDVVSSVNALGANIPTVITLYDLIPLVNSKQYLDNYPAYKSHYLRKTECLKRADACLAISEYSAKEGRDVLGLSSDKVFNISSGCDPIFVQKKLSDADAIKRTKDFGITREFILYTGGADPRKNLHGLLKAYVLLSPELRQNLQLVIVGKIRDEIVHDLKRSAQKSGLKSEDLIFTGYVPDASLVDLYSLCKLSVFPSLHEGFGLPALEGMRSGAPVIASNITSIPEIMGREEAMFDPYSTQSMADLITKVICDDEFRSTLIVEGLKQAEKFSWSISAQKALKVFEDIHSKRHSRINAEPDLIKSLASISSNVSKQELMRLAQVLADH